MSAGTYAAETSVSPEKSRSEIERTLERYGASDFGYMVTTSHAQVAFKVGEHTVRMRLGLPDVAEFRTTTTGRARSVADARAAREKAVRQRWRALTLAVKAKLEVIESGLATFEEEWFAYLVLPDGGTVYEQAAEQYRASIATGRTVPLLEVTS